MTESKWNQDRGWMFDAEVTCPFCGEHKISYSKPSCPKFGQSIDERYFVILKFMELEYKIKKLEEKVFGDEKEESG